MPPMLSKLQVSALLCFVAAPQLVTALTRFESWFPRYEAGLNFIVQNNCTTELAVREHRIPLGSEAFSGLDVWDEETRSGVLINCILRSVPEIVKANFAAAAVLLGLMPGLLAMLSPSIQETSALLTVGDRPLLALIICLGSPIVGLDRELHIRGSIRALSGDVVGFGLRRRTWLTCIQYVVALGAVANIAEIMWELWYKVSFSWFQGDAFVLSIWSFVGFIIHLFAALALSTSIRVGRNVDTRDATPWSMTWNWFRWRFSLRKRNGPVQVVVQPHSFLYFLLVAFITCLILIQITFGTILFSGILFISVIDAVFVFLRFLASVVACRVLVLMELVLIREVTQMEDAKQVYKQVSQSTIAQD